MSRSVPCYRELVILYPGRDIVRVRKITLVEGDFRDRGGLARISNAAVVGLLRKVHIIQFDSC